MQQQDFGSWCTTLLVFAACSVTAAVLGAPRPRPYAVWDVTISYPYYRCGRRCLWCGVAVCPLSAAAATASLCFARGGRNAASRLTPPTGGDWCPALPCSLCVCSSSTVPYTLALCTSLAALVASVLALELWAWRRLYADATQAVAAMLHFVAAGLGAFLVSSGVTVVLKQAVGRLRPDFLDLCKPALPPAPLVVRYGLSAADSPACTAAASASLTDGHYSFPSGHTSTVFVFAMYTALYCTWASSMRCGAQGTGMGGGRGWVVLA